MARLAIELLLSFDEVVNLALIRTRKRIERLTVAAVMYPQPLPKREKEEEYSYGPSPASDWTRRAAADSLPPG